MNELNYQKVKEMSTKGITKYLINKYRIFNGAKSFYSGRSQNYFVFIPATKYIKYCHSTTQIYSCKSNGMSEGNIANKTKSNNLFASTFVNHYILPDATFNGHCSINNNTSIPKKVINIYISYMLNQWPRDLNTDFTIGNSLFGSVTLTKNADPDKYVCSSYGIGFDLRSEFSLPDGREGKNAIIFGADMSSSVHIDNKKKDIFIPGEDPTQGLDDTTIIAEVK